MAYSIWGRGVVETSPVYRIRVHHYGGYDYSATVRVGRTAIACHEASSAVGAVMLAVASVRRYRKSGALAQLRAGDSSVQADIASGRTRISLRGQGV